MRYDSVTRWLHAGLALGISVQLILSLVMAAPVPGEARSAFSSAAFEAHEVLGMTILGLLAAHWVWQLMGHAVYGFGHLFPWFSASRRDAIVAEVKRLSKSRLREWPEDGALAGGAHGLGLLVASAMAVSGGVLFFGMAESGAMPPPVHIVKEIHGFIATFMWIYFGAHAGMAVLHQYFGHRTLSEMFTLKK